MIYKHIGRHQMNRRSYLCLYVYDNSKEFKIGIAGFSIYGTKSEKLRFYLGSSSRNFFSPPKLKMPPRALALPRRKMNWFALYSPPKKWSNSFFLSSMGPDTPQQLGCQMSQLWIELKRRSAQEIEIWQRFVKPQKPPHAAVQNIFP